MFPSQNPGFAWLADCLHVSLLCREALPGLFLSENGREYRFLCRQATGLSASFSPFRERVGALTGILGGKHVGTPIGSEFRTAVALLGRGGEDFDHHCRVGEHRPDLFATGHDDIRIQVALLGEFRAGVTAIGSARRAPQRTHEEIGELRTDGAVGDTATGHVNDGVIVVGGGRRAQHEHVAIEVFVLGVRCVIQGEILLDGHVEAIAHL